MANYGYIYKITNDINGKIYIGQKKCKKENMTEYEMLNDGYFGSGIRITRAEEKYGLENFTKEIVCVCENKEDLDMMEKFCIMFAKTEYEDDCYNIAEGGGAGNPFEYKTDEEKAAFSKMRSELATKRWDNYTDEEKAAIFEKQKETKANKSPEEKAKISEARTKYHNITMFDCATLESIRTFTTFKEAHQYLLDNNITISKNKGIQANLKYACDNHTKAYGYYWSWNTFIETDEDDEKDLFFLCKEEM